MAGDDVNGGWPDMNRRERIAWLTRNEAFASLEMYATGLLDQLEAAEKRVDVLESLLRRHGKLPSYDEELDDTDWVEYAKPIIAEWYRDVEAALSSGPKGDKEKDRGD